jgi:hypothetical protein
MLQFKQPHCKALQFQLSFEHFFLARHDLQIIKTLAQFFGHFLLDLHPLLWVLKLAQIFFGELDVVYILILFQDLYDLIEQ